MREETRKRLDRLRGSGWLPAFAILALLLAGFIAFHTSAGDERRLSGTVQSADWRMNNETGEHYPYIEAVLDSGSSVRVESLVPALPDVGARITLRQRAMLFRYMTTYQWDGPAPAAAPTPASYP